MSIRIASKDDLEQKLGNAGDKLILIYFSATWCGPCKAVAPKLDKLANTTPNFMVLKVDVDECDEVAQEYNITSVPTFYFIRNKKVVKKFSGSNFETLCEVITELT